MISQQQIAFVGVGRMGANMARRLDEVGYSITGLYDKNETAAQALADELSTTAYQKLHDITAAADVIFTIVSDDEAMRDIFFQKEDSLLYQAKGKTFINCATVSPSLHQTIEAAAEKVGATSLEACMASSIPQARAGSLYLMCGGQKEVFERIKPLLQSLSSSLRYLGPAGHAAQVKALVNMVMNANTAALAEGLGLGDALGLDLTVLREVFSQTGAASRVLETDGADMQHRDHKCYFSVAHAAKDSGIAVALAQQAGLSLPLAQATWSQYQKLMEQGKSDLDKSAIAELTFLQRLRP